mgnify:CR=1 FL=1
MEVVRANEEVAQAGVAGGAELQRGCGRVRTQVLLQELADARDVADVLRTGGRERVLERRGAVLVEQAQELGDLGAEVLAALDAAHQIRLAAGDQDVQAVDAAVLTGGVLGLDERLQVLGILDTQAAVALYLRLYPLLQQAYRDLGYPDRHFNDRFVAVLDHLIAAPEPTAPVTVALDDKGNWIYTDTALESASAGQKFLMRLGPQHETAVKAKLRDIRSALAGAKP